MSGRARLPQPYPGPGHAVLMVLGVLAVQTLLGVAITVVIMLASGKGLKPGEPAPQLPLAALLVTNLVAFGAVLSWAATANRGMNRALWRGGCAGPGAWLAAVVGGLGTTIAITVASNLLQRVLPMPESFAALFRGLTDVGHAPVIATLTVVVVPAVAEEALFRGYILRGLLGHVRPWTALALTTLLFTVLHMNPWQVPAGVGLGLLCGWVYLRTRSLVLCMVLHGVNNALALFSDRLWDRVPFFTDETTRTLHPWTWWYDLLGLALLVVGLVAFARLTRGLISPPPLPVADEEPPPLPVALAASAEMGSGLAEPPAGPTREA